MENSVTYLGLHSVSASISGYIMPLLIFHSVQRGGSLCEDFVMLEGSQTEVSLSFWQLCMVQE